LYSRVKIKEKKIKEKGGVRGTVGSLSRFPDLRIM
jgi:hypothetical protein